MPAPVGWLIVDIRYGQRTHHAEVEAGLHPRWFDEVVACVVNLGAAPEREALQQSIARMQEPKRTMVLVPLPTFGENTP